MSIFKRLFGGGSKEPGSSDEHAVIVRSALSDDGFGSEDERVSIHALTDQLERAIEDADAREFVAVTKLLAILLLLLDVSLIGGCGADAVQDASSGVGRQVVSEIKIERVHPADEEILEEWSRVTNESDLLGVGAARISDKDWPWQVHVSVMEFVRIEPLESELDAAITAALAGVHGVKQAHHDDRETWVISGQPDGSALVQAAAAVVDQFSSRAKAMLDELDSGK